jgi:hypothetical protein
MQLQRGQYAQVAGDKEELCVTRQWGSCGIYAPPIGRCVWVSSAGSAKVWERRECRGTTRKKGYFWCTKKRLPLAPANDSTLAVTTYHRRTNLVA